MELSTEAGHHFSFLFFFLKEVESHKLLLVHTLGKMNGDGIYARGGVGNSSSGYCNPLNCLHSCISFNEGMSCQE